MDKLKTRAQSLYYKSSKKEDLGEIDKIQKKIEEYEATKKNLDSGINAVKNEVDKKISDVDGLYTYFKDTYFYKEVDKEKEKIKNDTKLDVIQILSEYGNQQGDKIGKTYIPSEFQTEYLQLKTYIPDLESLTFEKKEYENVAKLVSERYRPSNDAKKQVEIFNEFISNWDNRRRYGYDYRSIIEEYKVILVKPGEPEITNVIKTLRDETRKISDKLKKQLEDISKLKAKKEEMIRKLRESRSGTSVKVIATLRELNSEKDGRNKFNEIYQHIYDNQLFVNVGEERDNVELFCSYGILRCRLEEIEIYIKKYESVSKKLKAILEKQKDIESYGTVSYSFLQGEIKQIYKIFQKYGLAGKSIGYTDPNRIWRIVLETFGKKASSIRSVPIGADKLEFKDFEVLRGNDDAIEVFCTKNKLNSLEKRSFRLAIREILGELDKINKEKEQKLQKEKEKEEKKKQDELKERELKEKLKQDIKDSKDTEEGKAKKLEELEKLEKLEAEKDRAKKEDERIQKERESIVLDRIKQLEDKTREDQLRIDRLTQDKELVLKTMNSSLTELTSYKAGHSELVDQKRKLLMDTIEKLKKKKEIQDKQYAELVLMNERNKNLLAEIKSEESKIKDGSKELKGQLLRMKEKEKLYLMERQKYMKQNKELIMKLDKQRKRTHKKTKEDTHTEIRPITFTREGGKKRTNKKDIKKDRGNQRKRVNGGKIKNRGNMDKSFSEKLKSVFVN